MRTTTLIERAIAIVALLGCRRDGNPPAPPDVPPPPVASAPVDSSPVRPSPHGGTMVRVAGGELHVEVLYEPAVGKLTAFILGADRETATKLDQPSLAVELAVPGRAAPLRVTLLGVASEITGETESRTSVFAAREDPLKGLNRFTVTIPELVVRDRHFSTIVVPILTGGPT